MPFMGWTRDLADFRDFRARAVEIKPPTQAKVDLRANMPPVMDQGELGSCTAHAALAVMGYYQRKTHGRYIDLSRLFLYKVTRMLAKKRGDSGAELRTAMQAMVMVGAPPEEYWPYDISKFEQQPDAFLMALAGNYQATSYVRHDSPGVAPKDVLLSIKQSLAHEVPVMFGTTVYKSFPGVGASDDHTGVIPFPGSKDKIDGGHAMVIAGYDDGVSSFLVRNSWGEKWGDKGYGWMPYRYVTSGIATDFWSLLTAEFTDIALFQ